MPSDIEFREKFFEKHPDFYRNDRVNADTDLSRSERRDPQFRRLLAQGQLLPVSDGEGRIARPRSIRSRVSDIASLPLAQREAQIPDSERRFIDKQRSDLQGLIDSIRGGTFQAQTTSEDQRTRLINKAEQTFGRQLQQGLEDQLGFLNARGLLPSTTTGFSSLAADSLARERARLFEDPLTSFIRDLDIQTEADRVARNRQLQDIATDLQTRLLGSGEQLGQFLGNLDLSNINSQRSFVSNLVGQDIAQDNAFRALEEQIRQFNINDALRQNQFHASLEEAERARRDAKSGGLLGALGGLAGTILPLTPSSIGGTLLGKIGGGLSSLFGGAGKAASNAVSLAPSNFNFASSFGGFTPSNFGFGPDMGSFGQISTNPFTGAFELR